jgi:thiosulfate reductase cytochrome b subunit
MSKRQAFDQELLDEQPMSEKAGTLTELIIGMRYVQRDVREIKDSLGSNYITRQEFQPVQKLVYGFVVLALIAIVGGLLALVVNQGGQ